MGDRSTEVVTYMPASLLRAVIAHPARSLPWCDQVDGTMVMADLSGFTALSERLAKVGDEGAERLTGIINSFFEKMLKTASSYGGDAQTFGGDAILLLFEGQDHAARAVSASLGMLKQVERVAAVEVDGGKIKIGMSVGAHSGTFVLAAAGLAEERAHLFVLGRGAETTALAEAQAERGQLAVSAETRGLLPGGSTLTPTGDYWRVDELSACALPRVAAERPQVLEQHLGQLAPFLPPYARTAAGDGCRRVQHEPEHRRTVIVFVSILGLNEIIESTGIDAALEQLQTYTVMLTRLAAKHQGFVVSSDIASQGSKLVITFGTPVAHEYAPANAARFALDLTEDLLHSGLDLQHKIGLNGGHVFAGEVGPSFRRQYTVMGDAVNLAARLMGAAKPGEALISRNLLDYVSPDLCARELAPIKVKGKEQPVGVCVLEKHQPAGGQVRGGAGSGPRQGPLFGRRAELDLLRHTWEEVQGGNGRTLLLEGEAGLGKTRLLEESLRASPDTAVVTRAACFEYLQAAPFAPWVDVLYSIFEIAAEDSTDERTEKVQVYLQLHLTESVEFGSLLNPLLNITLRQSRVVASLEAQFRRQKLLELVSHLLVTAAAEHGCVLVIEDLHWMDESSLALVRFLAEHIAGAKVLLLLTSRPTEEPLALRDAAVTRLALAELPESESLAMVREALDVEDLPAEVGEAIYAKTKGNPLFLEEVIHSLRGPGVLERILSASSVTRAAELAALEIPDRVQGLLMSRIDRLPPDTREVLKAGSVVGRSFDEEVLRSIDDEHLRPVSLDRALDELIAAALVVPAEELSSVTFRHALVQDVAYESLPFARRRHLHGEIGHYLESVQSSPDHALLVHHYSRAGEADKTRVHAVRASASSVAVYANLEAVDYLDIALGTVRGRTPTDACQRSRLEELVGDSLQTLGRHDQAIESFMAARRRWASSAVRYASTDALCDVSPIEDGDARESLLCWKISVSMQRGPAAFKRAVRWLDIGMCSLPPDRKELAARILVAQSVCRCRLARHREALTLADEGLALARQSDDTGLVAYGCTVRSLALSQLGRFGEAIGASREAVVAYEQAGDLVGQALSHMNLGLAYQLMDSPREGLEQLEISLAIYGRLGDKNGVEQMHHNIGSALLQLGELDEGIRHLEETIAARGSEGCPPLQVGWAYVLLAQGHLMKEDIETADLALREGREILESIDAQSFLLDTEIVEAQLDLARGRLNEAARKCERVVAASRSAGAAPIEAEALRVLGQVRIAEGRPEAAIPDLETCVALADESGSLYARALGLVVLAEAQASCAARDPSREDTLGEAIRLFEQMGIRHELKKALKLRERLVSSSPAGG